MWSGQLTCTVASVRSSKCVIGKLEDFNYFLQGFQRGPKVSLAKSIFGKMSTIYPAIC